MRRKIATACAVLAMTAWGGGAAQAQKTSTAEIVAGVVVPLGEDEYQDFIEQSFKFGARFAFFGDPPSRRQQVGLEIAFDWTPARTDLDEVAWVDASFHRFRALAGARLRKGIGRRAAVFFRAAGGVDVVTGRIEEELLGTDWEESDLGVALELGGGVAAHLDNVLVGAQAAFPIAFHWDEDPDDNWDYDYTGFDFDFLFTVGTLF